MNIVIKQGDLQVVQTGTVLVSNDESTLLIIDNNYKLKISYKNDTDSEKQEIKVLPQNEGVEIELKNFNNPLGTATTAPMPIAQKNEEKMYLSLAVSVIGTVKMLTYGIYLGK